MRPIKRYLALLLLSGLLTLHTLILLDSARKNFVTVDEAAHLAAGVSHWQTGSFELYRVNPPLPRMLAVLPVLAMYPETQCLEAINPPGTRREFKIADPFAQAHGQVYLNLVFLARLAGIGWSLLGAVIIYLWCRDLYGRWAGLLGVALWCFEPNVLAHAALATPDVPATVAGLAATYCFWHYLRRPSWSGAGLCGILLGIAELTKCSLLLLYVLWPVLWLLHRICRRGEPSASPGLGVSLIQGGTIAVLSIFVLNLGYGFQQTGRRLDRFPFVSRALGVAGARESFTKGAVVNRFTGHWLGRLVVPLPADYLRGIDEQRRDFELGHYHSYLTGEWRFPGWWYWYLHALGVKVPVAVWLMVLWSLTLSLWGHPCSAGAAEEWTLWIPAVAFLGFVSSQAGYTNHLRYVLPLFPFVIIATSKLGYFLRPDHWKMGLGVVALTAWLVAGSGAVHPHYLSYFNELAGGPEHGYEHLIDSNIDWGQDLLYLKKWLNQHPEARPLHLAYFNLIDPRLIGIEFQLPPNGPTAPLFDNEDHSKLGPVPGYHAISVNYLQGHDLVTPHNGGGTRVHVPKDAFAYFRLFRPVAKAGYSIFIYHISHEEANKVRRRLGLPPLLPLPAST